MRSKSYLNPICIILKRSFLFFLFFLLSCSYGKITGSIVPKQVGMYPYRCQTLTGYEIFDKINRLKKRVIIKRDHLAHMIEKTNYDESNRLTVRYIYKRNKKGLLLKRLKFDAHGNMMRYSQYFYYPNGKLKKQKDFTVDGNLTKSSRFYFRDHGERIRKEIFDASGHLTKTVLYIYNSDNLRIKDFTLSETGEIKKSTCYEYGLSGKIETIKYMNSLDSMNGTAVIVYGENKNRIEKKKFDAKGSLKSITKYHY